jgi:hypothetical protein
MIEFSIHSGVLLSLFDSEDGGDMFARNSVDPFNGLHGVLSQRIVVLFNVKKMVRLSV